LQANERVIILGISLNQSAFIKGRQLVDTVVPVNEIIDLVKKSRREYLIFKVDFEKVYDRLCKLGFPGLLMVRFGLYDTWRV